MRKLLAGIGALALLAASPVVANASSLSVSPTTIDLTAPEAASTIGLTNNGSKPVTVQLRVFRWSQVNGKEKLTATNDVVASPPVTKMQPGKDYTVRIVRTSKKPIAGEETYRVLVDEVPVKSQAKPGVVGFIIRHSIPVFFGSADGAGPDVKWAVAKSASGASLVVQNAGDGRLKLTDLNLSQNGKALVNRQGLIGYVLGGSTMTFPLGKVRGLGSSPLVVKASSQNGPLTAKAAVSSR